MTQLDEKLVETIEEIAKIMYEWGVEEDPIDQRPPHFIANWARTRLKDRGYEVPLQEDNNDPLAGLGC